MSRAKKISKEAKTMRIVKFGSAKEVISLGSICILGYIRNRSI